MKTKIPPPIVTLVSALLIFFSRELFPNYVFEYQSILGIAIFISGLMILFSAVSLFKEKETTVNPMSPEKASSLVVDGVFKYTRNPMYLGLLIFQIGLGMSLKFIHITLFSIFTFFVFDYFVIRREEKYLEKKFKNEYLVYKNKVRRWL